MMASCVALPRKVHFDQVCHIFGYLKKHHDTELVFGPSSPYINIDDFERREWTTSEFRHLLEEDLKPKRTSNIPAPRCIMFTVRGKVDANHATDTVTRRSWTGFIMCLNNSPTHWFSKKQNDAESSSFGLEFTGVK